MSSMAWAFGAACSHRSHRHDRGRARRCRWKSSFDHTVPAPGKTAVWKKALKSCADPVRVTQALEQMAGTSAQPLLEKATVEQARILAALWSGSQAMGALLVKHPDWLASVLTTEHVAHPRQEQGLRREVGAGLNAAL